MKKLWGGAFSGESSALADAFGRSFDSDLTLFHEDVTASIVHATMLGKCGIIPQREASAIIKGLREILKEGPLALPTDCEDIHAAVEARLMQKCGAIAGKLHTARSRNDQIATDVRLWLRKALAETAILIKSFQRDLLTVAKIHSGTLMPGFTHQQPAQPITLGFHHLAYFWMMQRHGFRIESVAKLCDQCPLGSAALAGTSFPIDRHLTSDLLGFDSPTPNALDATSDRSFVLDSHNVFAQIMLDLSRLAQEFIMWSSPAFGFVRLSDALTTGSSIMPQKRNPDMAELIRSRSSRVLANWNHCATMMKGLPLAYNRDLQDDKPALFESQSIVHQSLQLMSAMVTTSMWNQDCMSRAAGGGFSTATDVADAIAAKGQPFRKAHELVGKMVRHDEEIGHLTANTVKKLAPMLADDEIRILLNPASAAASRNSFGGCGKRALRKQLTRAQQLHRKLGFMELT